MSTIVTRAGKGAPLTHNEVDANFTNLNADKYQAGDSPSFGSITVTGTVDGRDVSADGAKLDGIEAGATADQTAAEILTAIKTVDGTGSGLDADTLDGQHASAFLTGNQTITLSGDVSGSGTTSINAQLAANVVGANELNVVGNGTTAQYLRSDGDGTFTWATPPDTNTTYTAGGGLSLVGTTFSHSDTSAQGSVNNSGSVYIQDITLDTYGHVTGITSTTVPASAPTTAQVLSATAGASAGAVGTYAWARTTSTTTLAFGSTYAGSSLTSSGVLDDNAGGVNGGGNNYQDKDGGVLSGTWRCMGQGTYAGSWYHSNVFLRIA